MSLLNRPLLLLRQVAVLELQVSLQLLGAAIHGGAAVLALLVGGGAGCRHACGGRLSVVEGSFWKHMTFKSTEFGQFSTVTAGFPAYIDSSYSETL